MMLNSCINLSELLSITRGGFVNSEIWCTLTLILQIILLQQPSDIKFLINCQITIVLNCLSPIQTLDDIASFFQSKFHSRIKIIAVTVQI